MSSKITYVTLFADESIHPSYEKALSEVEREIGQTHPMYIGGKEVNASATFTKTSPIDTSIVIGKFQKGGAEHALQALNVAKSAFKEWGALDYKERAKIMRKVADKLEQNRFRLSAIITLEAGKNRLEALAEVYEAIEAMRYYANLIEKEEGYVKRMSPGAPGEETYSVARPYGVWAVISPFNFPLMLGNGMAQGALITGNTVVWKPTSEAPLTALEAYKIYSEAGLPDGVLNVVTGPGEAFEEVFVKGADGIAFTGSKDVGMNLYRKLATLSPYPKPIVLEMGSKNPVIVTKNAKIDKAVEGVVRAAFGYSGQKCSATSRVYVQNEIRKEFVDALVKRTSSLVVGDPRKRETFMGPVINRNALENYEKYVSDAANAGKILIGGKVLKQLERGYYVEPTIVEGLPEQHYLFKKELFLPILLVAGFETLDEAINKANDTEYGLTAGIMSEDPEEVRQFMENIQFGVVYANRRGGATTGAWPGAQTFVGWKASGATGRGVGGPYYLLNYLREQARTYVHE
ncbi:1-pyrroline-5-carboxylate dehydrogenase [Candidatus Marsarchaeota G1 archaeon BE_D]|jgi:1-pyrroline-5-carboxylate dehydrogenase|uniref:L-glutamate gamma-semialdehyde dehydrogenase n=1 Tax=Candidatus Marsarchaeota G1 archaeon BE_D TaxID=1978156 RepID=A0A2R6AHN3_9ARCH|nr:MAG: 1-pyrroline-5-carboxylate dehydrogenase [Candidatus Marsarchaeota G1 archaeon BE_D]